MSGAARRPDEILDEVLDLPAAGRAARLDELCGGDADLRAEIASLVTAFEASGDFLEDTATLDLAGDDRAPAPADAVGRVVGAYTVQRHLGSGGSGDVYLASRSIEGYEHLVALKLIRAPILAADALRRFRTECRVLARLDHPGIARLIEGAVTDDGAPYLVVEYVDGLPLDRHADAAGLAIRERLALLVQVCEAVRHLHRHSVLHRDLKPANVLVDAGGRVRLIDFGIARVMDIAEDENEQTMTGWERMTPAYASPEQLRGEMLTTASDVYALGVLAYQLLTGRLPYRSRRRHDLEREMTTTGLRRPSDVARQTAPTRARELAGDLDTILLKALHQDPDRRYPSAESLREDLCRYLDGQPVLARGDSFAYRAGKFVRRHTAAVAAATLAVLVLVGATVTGFALYGRAETSRREADRQRAAAEETVEFLSDLLATADPSETGAGADLTMRDVLDLAATNLDQQLHDRPAVAAPLHLTIGSAYANLGLYDDADTHLGAAAQLYREGASDDPGDRLECDLIRASLARMRGQRDWADSLLTTMLAGPLPDDPELVGSIHLALSQIREQQTRYAEAAELVRIAIAAAEPLLGTPSLLPARTTTHLGLVFMRQGDYAAADSIMAAAAAIARRDLGDADVTTAECVQNHAVVLASRGRWRDAIAAYTEVLAVYERAYPPGHVELAVTRTNLGDALINVGEYELAGEHYAVARTIFADRLGTQHAYWAMATLGSASAAEFLGQLDEADRLYDQAITVLTEQLGPDHLWTASALGSRARLAVKRGDPDAAAAMAAAAVAALERQFPDGHPRLGKPLLVLADIALREGRPDDTLALTARIRDLDLPVASVRTDSELLRIRALVAEDRRREAGQALGDLRNAVEADAGADPTLAEWIEAVAGELEL